MNQLSSVGWINCQLDKMLHLFLTVGENLLVCNPDEDDEEDEGFCLLYSQTLSFHKVCSNKSRVKAD